MRCCFSGKHGLGGISFLYEGFQRMTMVWAGGSGRGFLTVGALSLW